MKIPLKFFPLLLMADNKKKIRDVGCELKENMTEKLLAKVRKRRWLNMIKE